MERIEADEGRLLLVDAVAEFSHEANCRALRPAKTYLNTVYTVCKKAVPICQSMPSEFGGVALGHVRHNSGSPEVGPMR